MEPPSQSQNDIGIGYIRLAEILTLLPIGKTTFYRWIKMGIVPPPVIIGHRISMWRRQEIHELLRRLPSERHLTDAETKHERMAVK